MNKIGEYFLIAILIVMMLIFAAVLGLMLYSVFNLDETDHYQLTLDRYQQFEQQCIEREFTQDECLLIWAGK